MSNRALQLLSLLLFLFFLFFTSGAIAQRRGSSSVGASSSSIESPSNYEGILGSLVAPGLTPPGQVNYDLWSVGNDKKNRSPLQGPSGSVSMLDLKAPEKARREYGKGYQLLMRKDLQGAVEHLTAAISIYPDFVSAHNALGTAYFQLDQNIAARDQFTKAISLDDHLPGSYLNLGCAQLALQDYRDAEESVQKASSMAPLDLQLATSLAYAQLMNRDYAAVLTTAHEVHSRKHEGAAIVHYFAAAAWESQRNLQETQNELETLLREDPTSAAAEEARQILDQFKARQIKEEEQKKKQSASPANPSGFSSAKVSPSPEQVSARLQVATQESKEEKQIAEAEGETATSMCATCSAPAPPSGDLAVGLRRLNPGPALSVTPAPFAFRSRVDEVAVFFAATDHGKSVTDLTRGEVGILDNQKPPAAITGFRNEAELPLRLGIIIDTSESVTGRFSFEQRAANHFLQKVLTHKDDLAFVVGVANSVLLVQDFTNNQQQIAHAIDQLAPGGGTAVWDAVTFAAHKLAGRPETQPVAKLLVVISDGKDNSSGATLKEAIESAEGGEVCVYTVSAGAIADDEDQPPMGAPVLVGDRAMRLLAGRTGGAAFVPKSLWGLDHGLDEVQQVIRSRYLISYKPALFEHDGQYRAIDISARKSGHKLRVYARRGYYARVNSAAENDF